MITSSSTTEHRLERIERALVRVLRDGRRARQVEPWPQWMTIETAARYCDLSSASVRRMLSAGTLTAHRPARGRVLIDRTELDAAIRTATGKVRRGRGMAKKE